MLGVGHKNTNAVWSHFCVESRATKIIDAAKSRTGGAGAEGRGRKWDLLTNGDSCSFARRKALGWMHDNVTIPNTTELMLKND